MRPRLNYKENNSPFSYNIMIFNNILQKILVVPEKVRIWKIGEAALEYEFFASANLSLSPNGDGFRDTFWIFGLYIS